MTKYVIQLSKSYMGVTEFYSKRSKRLTTNDAKKAWASKDRKTADDVLGVLRYTRLADEPSKVVER